MNKNLQQVVQEKKQTQFVWGYRFAVFIILLASIGLLYIIYLLFIAPTPTILKATGPVTVTPTTVKAGEQYIIDLPYCKTADANSIIYRHLQSVQQPITVLPMALLTGRTPIGCGHMLISNTVPTYITSGQYQMVLSFQYQFNAVRATNEIFVSNSFTITP